MKQHSVNKGYGAAQILRDVGLGIGAIILLAALLWWLLADNAVEQPAPQPTPTETAAVAQTTAPMPQPPPTRQATAETRTPSEPAVPKPAVPGPAQTRQLEALASIRLQRVHDALAAGNWFSDSPDSALRLIRKLEASDPGSAADLHQELNSNASFRLQSLLDDGKDKEALQFLARVKSMDPDFSAKAVERTMQDKLQDMAQSVTRFIAREKPEDAAKVLARMVTLSPGTLVASKLDQDLRALRKRLAGPKARTLRDPLAGGGRGPVMAIVPAGDFTMGSTQAEPGHWPKESPTQEIHFATPFAIGLTEVTVAEFGQFVKAAGYTSDAEKAHFSRIYYEGSGLIQERNKITWRQDFSGDTASTTLPVVHVSWNDAQAYAQWLSSATGHHYRLPSEAEFEYALRGGTTTPYWWGSASPDALLENLAGDGDRSPHGSRGWGTAFKHYGDGFFGPAPVGSFRTNPFGLHDMAGNVSEWNADCWQDSLLGTASDGAPHGGQCTLHVIRGGSWSAPPNHDRSAYRSRRKADFVSAEIGFRVARDMP